MADVDNPNLVLLETAVMRLGKLVDDLVFVGGCAVGLLITESGAGAVRATIDVDVIIEVQSLLAYHRFEETLRQLGFTEDQSLEAPMCRWLHQNVILDVMPTDPAILGFGNQWFAAALAASKPYRLPSGATIQVLPAPLFVATKLDAFASRGQGDYLMSEDMEDIVAVIDGRPEIVEEIDTASVQLRLYLIERFSRLRTTLAFTDAVGGYLPSDTASQARRDIILSRIEAIANLPPH